MPHPDPAGLRDLSALTADWVVRHFATLPEQRSAALVPELKLLKKTAERLFYEPEDRAMAEIGDLQGVG